MLYKNTDIDGPSLNPEQLNVRGKNLNESIGRLSYTGAVGNLLLGKELDRAEEELLDRYLCRSLLSLEIDDLARKVVGQIAGSGASISRAIIGGLMVDRSAICAEITKEFSLAEIGLDADCQRGLYFFALIPSFLLGAVETILAGDGAGAKLSRRWKEVGQGSRDYLGNIFFLCTGRDFGSDRERKVFNHIMVSFHAGFGFITPTVMLPRVAIGTAVPIEQAIAAGFTGAGPAHVGACEEAMVLFASIQKTSDGNGAARAIEIIEQRLARKEKVPGFGHPMFKQDPRNPHLRSILAQLEFDSEFIEIYDAIVAYLHEKLGINPNIDGISAAIFLSLGVHPLYGTGLFLCSRTAAMVAHIIEMKQKPAFGAKSESVRKWFASIASGSQTGDK